MSQGSDRRAIQAFVAPMQEAIRCVSHVAFRQGGGERYGKSMLTVARWAELDQREGLPLKLSIQRAHVIEQGNVRTTKYAYDIEFDGEVLQFHWHPGKGTDCPHVNLRGISPTSRLMGRHIPTARTSLESVIRFLIVELGAIPITPNWGSILQRNEREFVSRCSWWSLPPS